MGSVGGGVGAWVAVAMKEMRRPMGLCRLWGQHQRHVGCQAAAATVLLGFVLPAVSSRAAMRVPPHARYPPPSCAPPYPPCTVCTFTAGTGQGQPRGSLRAATRRAPWGTNGRDSRRLTAARRAAAAVVTERVLPWLVGTLSGCRRSSSNRGTAGGEEAWGRRQRWGSRGQGATGTRHRVVRLATRGAGRHGGRRGRDSSGSKGEGSGSVGVLAVSGEELCVRERRVTREAGEGEL